jgi:pimeloyl-ACP methyl ester carboxylesterase
MKHFDFGGTEGPLHFLHANGYPPECYKPLLEFWKSDYRVFGMLLRPLWDDAIPEELQSWHPLTGDLLRFLAEHNAKPVIGVGHSIGAVVTLRAALRDPARFKALVLIDPVLFTPFRLVLWRIFKSLGVGERIHPLIAGAKKRRRNFDDRETVFKRYRKRSVFRYFSDENLMTYIEGITRKTSTGFELVYSPEWETQIYRTGLQDFDLWRGLPTLNVPTLILRGAETDTFLESAARLVREKQPNVRVEALPKSTHLLPLERPKEVFEIMQNFLSEVL